MSLLTKTLVMAKHPSDVIGNWGPVQRTIIIVIILSYHIAPFRNSVIPLFAPKLNFTCHHVDEVSGRSVSLNNACHYTTPDGIVTECSNFTYDHSFYSHTMIEEFDLVCTRAWYASMAQSCHQMGYVVSGLALGFLSDRRGRLSAAQTAMLMEMAAGFGQVFAPNIWMLWISRFFIGIGAYGRFLTGYVLVTEWIGPKIRAKAVFSIEFGWHSGSALLLFFYYNVPDYKIVSTTAYSVEGVIFILYFLLVLESPRWLITNSRNEEAESVLTKAAKSKGKLPEAEIKRRIVSLQQHMMQEIQKEKTGKQSIADVWKDPVLLQISLILYFSWFTHGFIMYASFFNTENLGGSFFTNLTIFVVVDIVNYFILLIIINRLPRKKTMIWGIGIEVISLTGLLVVSLWDDTIAYRVILSAILRTAVGIVFQIIYLYTAETFPTAMRQASMGTCSLFARVGSVIAPFVKELTNYTHLSVSFAVFLILTIVNLTLILYLPDTGKIQVADTIGQKKQQVEEKGGVRSMSIVSALSFNN